MHYGLIVNNEQQNVTSICQTQGSAVLRGQCRVLKTRGEEQMLKANRENHLFLWEESWPFHPVQGGTGRGAPSERSQVPLQ